MGTVTVVDGDLLAQYDVAAIVNPWNRNVLPATRFTITGVSKAILRAAGPAPFRELRRHGVLPVGAAVVTGAGDLPYRAIVHVAAINLRHKASIDSVSAAVESAVRVAREHNLESLAFPLLGAGNGNLDPVEALAAMRRPLEDAAAHPPHCRIVRYLGSSADASPRTRRT